jgi:hypothetical protein
MALSRKASSCAFVRFPYRISSVITSLKIGIASIVA